MNTSIESSLTDRKQEGVRKMPLDLELVSGAVLLTISYSVENRPSTQLQA
jgi:hypothetical protein